jgi:glycosyltransferase involved in cell wall biosynthesis
MKKVLICAAFSNTPMHPRIEMEMRILKESGYSVELVSPEAKYRNKFWHLIGYFLLKYFSLDLIRAYSRLVKNYDIIHIYDLRLLPLAKRAKKAGKKVVYETIDDNVYLNFHSFQKLIPPLRIVKKPVVGMISSFERKYAAKWCDAVIVNSANLLSYFPPEKTSLIFYASPFEGISILPYSSEKKFALVYLGKLNAAKGANEYMSVLDKTGLPFFFFGTPRDQAAAQLLARPEANYPGNFGSRELARKLEELSQNYNLIGCSIIHPENESYKFQEANKDIDYLCMGIPFIGNDRPPTYEKIKAGCGLLWNDEELTDKLLNAYNGKLYLEMHNNCRKLYTDMYSQKIFKARYLNVINTF